MQITGLDGKTYAWNFSKYNKQGENCSIIHSRARILLHNLFPYDIIHEEVSLPGIRNEVVNKALQLDFYINSQKLAIEVQGEQHYKHTKFFHTNKLEFFRARKLDSLKRQWCQINGITLIELPYNESDEQWTQAIRNRQWIQ